MVTFTNRSTGAKTYYWDLDVRTSTEVSPTATYAGKADGYVVTLTAYSASGVPAYAGTTIFCPAP